MPLSFLKTILGELRGADLIVTQRGPEPATGYAFYAGTAIHLRHVWLAADTAVQNIVDQVTLADVVTGDLPRHVRDLTG